MFKLIIDQAEYDILDDGLIVSACKDAGIRFDCNSGVCGSCHIKILEGADNLTELTQEENDLGMDKDNRLACQCVIKTGTVKITF